MNEQYLRGVGYLLLLFGCASKFSNRTFAENQLYLTPFNSEGVGDEKICTIGAEVRQVICYFT